MQKFNTDKNIKEISYQITNFVEQTLSAFDYTNELL